MPEDCPQGAKELIQRLQTTLKDAKDFHLELSLPYQLSAVTPPVITNCQDWKECEAAIGSYLYPVQSSFVSDSLYAYLRIDSRLYLAIRNAKAVSRVKKIAVLDDGFPADSSAGEFLSILRKAPAERQRGLSA